MFPLTQQEERKGGESCENGQVKKKSRSETNGI